MNKLQPPDVLNARRNFPPKKATYLFDGDLLSGVAVPHLDDVAAGAVPEVAEQLQVVDRSLHADAVQLQEAVLKGRRKLCYGACFWGIPCCQ